MRFFHICAVLFFSGALKAQPKITFISTSTTAIGSSAISINTLVAKTYNPIYPFYDHKVDSATGFFLFSARLKSDAGNHYLNKGFVGTIDMARDSINWLFVANTYELNTPGNRLLFSSEEKTMAYNKLHGFEEFKYPAKIQYTIPSVNRGLMYPVSENDQLNCISLADAAVKWSAAVPVNENWVDVKPGGDSVLLVAASGLHALHYGKGLLWSFPLITAERVTKALTYSLVNNNPFIRKISKVIETSHDENVITELCSNILIDRGIIYFAAKDKMIAVDGEGKLLWELDLKGMPVSKMYLSKRGGSLVLVNFGLANYADNYVSYGSPFVLSIDPDTGKIKNQNSLASLDNLVDFVITPRSMIFAGKKTIVEIKDADAAAEPLLTLDVVKYGSFDAFVDGSQYYTEKEGFYVTLNFINDNLLYFKADNNKVYGLDKSGLAYEYHFTEIYHLDEKIDNQLLVTNEDKTLLISANAELLFTFNLTDKAYISGNRIFFVGDRHIHSFLKQDLK